MTEKLITSPRTMAEIIDEMGFLPFFINDIPGFSVKELTPPQLWFSDTEDGPWEWKGPVIQLSKAAYGKFFGGKAMFVSKEWYPDFANYRRDGYDFDALWADGLASVREKQLYEKLDEYPSLLSKSLKELAGFGKGGIKGFDTVITKLQMKGYVINTDFEYQLDKKGRPYGWAVARFSTPEKFYGDYFTDNVYKLTPQQSKEKILSHLKTVLPAADEKALLKVIGG